MSAESPNYLDRKVFLRKYAVAGLAALIAAYIPHTPKARTVEYQSHLQSAAAILAEELPVRPQRLGTTFSVKQCIYLGFDYGQTQAAFRKLCSMGFDNIRIATYWHRIEGKGGFDFSEVDWQLEEAGRQNKEVILTVGVKSPRYPEFSFPFGKYSKEVENADIVDKDPQLAEDVREYVARLVEHTRIYPHLKYYQVENEPLNLVGVGQLRRLSYSFVQQEMSLVTSLKRANQKTLLTNAVGIPPAEEKFQEILSLNSDAVGINAYYKTPLPANLYWNIVSTFWDSQVIKWQQDMAKKGVEPFVAEAQAEPWEWGQFHPLNRSEYPSANPQDSVDWAVKLGKAGYKTVLLWGGEYWVGHNWKFGGQEWLRPIQDLINSQPVGA